MVTHFITGNFFSRLINPACSRNILVNCLVTMGWTGSWDWRKDKCLQDFDADTY